jgi:hypothetical protein
MVDLPEIPRRFVTTEAALPPVSASDISRPYTDFADALNDLGAALKSVGNKISGSGRGRGSAGKQTFVSTDSAGDLQVTNVEVVDDNLASDMGRAATLAYLTRIDTRIKDVVQKKAGEFDGKPAEFREWSADYVDQLATTQDTPFLESQVRRIAARHFDQSFSALSTRFIAESKAGVTAAVKGSLNSIVDDMATFAAAGASSHPAFVERQMDFIDLLQESAANSAIGLSKADADAYSRMAFHRARDAAVIGAIRSANESGGLDEALTAANAARESGVPDGSLSRRIDDELQSLAAVNDRAAAAELRAPIDRRESIERAGIDALADGSLDQKWLDRNADWIGPETFQRLNSALHATTPAAPDRAAWFGMLSTAASGNGAETMETAIDRMASGQITTDQFRQIVAVARGAEQDAGARPWANRLREAVAGQAIDPDRPARAGALTEFNTWLIGNPRATPGEARERATSIVDFHMATDRAAMRASLPLPAFTAAGRSTMSSDGLDAVGSRLMTAAWKGHIDLSGFVSQARLLDQWREATQGTAP